MILLYRSKDNMEATFLRDMLDAEGIASRLAGGASSIGLGELPTDALMVDIWVEPADEERARRLIEERQEKRPRPSADWICFGCGEKNDANFEVCWSCQRPPGS